MKFGVTKKSLGHLTVDATKLYISAQHVARNLSFNYTIIPQFCLLAFQFSTFRLTCTIGFIVAQKIYRFRYNNWTFSVLSKYVWVSRDCLLYKNNNSSKKKKKKIEWELCILKSMFFHKRNTFFLSVKEYDNYGCDN